VVWFKFTGISKVVFEERTNVEMLRSGWMVEFTFDTRNQNNSVYLTPTFSQQVSNGHDPQSALAG